jgi:pimeloyl-ACP methyl ester carboxylesterase
MSTSHHIVVVAGLGDSLYSWATRSWAGPHVIVHPHRVGWESGDFETKLRDLAHKIDLLADQGSVSLVGISAGGSLAVNALTRRPKSVHRVINVCGRLRAGQHVHPTLKQAARTSPAFFQSVEASEAAQASLDPALATRVLTLRARWDEVVPPSTVTLPGADNRCLLSAEHVLSITVGLVFYRRVILDFITC